jgi:hypothetical protein
MVLLLSLLEKLLDEDIITIDAILVMDSLIILVHVMLKFTVCVICFIHKHFTKHATLSRPGNLELKISVYKELILDNYKKTTLYVVRCNSKNQLVDSAPCNNCLNLILTLKIKRIVFSSNNNNIISIDPRLLQINHVSSGAKFFSNFKTSYNNIYYPNKNKSDTKKYLTNTKKIS